jgi:Pentapeptide repeats (9 copies)
LCGHTAAEPSVVGRTIVTIGDDDKIWQPSEIIRRYEAGERNFRGIMIGPSSDAADPQFRRANLAGADFSSCLIDADFSDANLQRARFAPANIKCCCFDRADLRNADFSGAAIDSATFDGAHLAGATFEDAGAYGYTYGKGEAPSHSRRPTDL